MSDVDHTEPDLSTASLPLLPAVRPTWTATVARRAVVVLAGVAVIALFAQLRVNIGPVPVTGQTLPVLLLGFAVGPRLAATTVGAYLAVGIAGLPVFTNLTGGWAALTGATGGYLLGFLAAAVLVGFLGDRGWHSSPVLVVLGMVLGNLVIYALGVAWLANALGLSVSAALAAGLTPFLAGDAVKIAVGAALLPTVARLAGDR
jgi:biotin transport system substrate-specific component